MKLKFNEHYSLLKYQVPEDCIAIGASQCVYVKEAARVVAKLRPTTLEPIWSHV